MLHVCRLTLDAVRAGDGRFHISRNWLDADGDDLSCWVGKVPDKNAIVSACPTTDEMLDTGTTPVMEPNRRGVTWNGCPTRTSPDFSKRGTAQKTRLSHRIILHNRRVFAPLSHTSIFCVRHVQNFAATARAAKQRFYTSRVGNGPSYTQSK